jgi:hypothetical protein
MREKRLSKKLLSAIEDQVLNWTSDSGSNPEQALLRIKSLG